MNLSLHNHIAASGLTQAELAERLGVSDRVIRYWLSGRVRRPQKALLDRLCSILEASEGDLGFTPPRVGRLNKGAKGVLRRRELLTLVSGVAAGTAVASLAPAMPVAVRIGQSDVDAVDEEAGSIRQTRRTLGGGTFRPDWVRHYYASTEARLMGGTYSDEATRKAGALALARLASSAGWAMVDGGHHSLAQKILLSGLSAARVAGDQREQAHLMGDLARQALYLDRYDTAADIMARAERLTLGPDAAGMVRARRARALGGLGNAQQVHRLGRRAVADYEPTDHGYESHLGGIAELWSDLGHASYSLARRHSVHAHADVPLRRAIATYAPSDGTSIALVRVRLVQTLMSVGDTRGAADEAASVLPTLGRLQSRQTALAAMDTWPLVREHAGQPGVADLGDMLRGMQLTV